MPSVMKSPRSVDIDITNTCNLRCGHCYHFGGPGDVKTDLPTREWLDFFETLGRAAVMSVTLAGGEPFLREDLKLLIAGIVKNRMRFSVLTNGARITEDMAAFIHETGRADHVQVSIDGSCAPIHDALRGAGAFEKAMNGIRLLQKHQASVAVRVTLHPGNLYDLPAIARLLLEELKLPGFSTNAVSCLGLGGENQDRLTLSTHDRMIAMRSLSFLNRNYGGRITAQAGPLAEYRHFQQMISFQKSGTPAIPGGGFLSGCGCVFHKIAINADGAIVPCVMLSHMKLGRINHDDFLKIWQTHPEMVAMRERRKISLSAFETCQGCDYISACTGNCPGIAYGMTGQVNLPSPDACFKRFLQEGGDVNKC